jgi:hypothetical protein
MSRRFVHLHIICCVDKTISRMTQYHGEKLTPVPPTLAPGVKRVIALFHDESCIHAFDSQTTAWLDNTQQILPRKSRGRLIHSSDFILQEGEGRLVIRDQNGKVVKTAQKVIYPGAGADPWWNMDQMVTQVSTH